MPRYSESELRDVAARASSLTEILRHFGLRPAGGNHRVLREWLDTWHISTEHFVGTPPPPRREPIPLEAVMVAGSRYQRRQLKERLYETGLKQRSCELCGQGEAWMGSRLALILDHINGVADDHRLENLRIVCPNCAATLDTHCGRANRLPVEPRDCLHCGTSVPAALRTPSLLLPRLRHPCAEARSAHECPAPGAAAIRAVARGGGRGELELGRAQVRRERQRGPQVGARV